jgi:hypothetical protein
MFQVDPHNMKRKLYSHAAIVMSSHIWFESEEFGVGEKIITEDKRETHFEPDMPDIPQFWRLHALKDDESIAVFRHPEMKEINRDEEKAFKVQVEKAAENLRYKAYSKLERLALASSLLNHVPRIQKFAMVLIGSVSRKKLIEPGPFCSELVCNIFRECDSASGKSIRILRVDRPPFQTSPSDLADQNISSLEPVADVMCIEDVSLADEVDFFSKGPLASLAGTEFANDVMEAMKRSRDSEEDKKTAELLLQAKKHTVEALESMEALNQANAAIDELFKKLRKFDDLG